MLICFAAPAAQDQCNPQEIAHIIAADAATDDRFGFSVAVSGVTAVAGAPFDNHEGGSDAGSAYVFVSSGPPGSGIWTQQSKLIASDTAASDNFGWSVAVSGDTAVVGAYLDSHAGGGQAGSAYVFVRSGASGSEVWLQQAKLTASDAATFDFFGISVAVSGDTAVVGAYQDNLPGGMEDQGSAYVFVRSGTSWIQQAKLTASDAFHADYFGYSVAIDGDTVVVGAYLDDHAGGTNAGSAYAFVRNGATWIQQAKLTASDAATFDYFGWSIALSGDTAIVGADLDNHAGGADAGSAYIFVRNGTIWTQQAKLTASDAAATDLFGYSVAVSGDTAVVGALYDDHAGGADAGSAYVFLRAGRPGSELWTQQAKLTASDAEAIDLFGDSIAVAGDTAVSGAPRDSHLGGDFAGSAYVFNLAECGPRACAGDLDASGTVNGVDLGLLLSQWTGAANYAPCPPYKPADLNHDCKVNGLDLATLLAAWGPCN